MVLTNLISQIIKKRCQLNGFKCQFIYFNLDYAQIPNLFK